MIVMNDINLTFAPQTVREKKALVDLGLQINEGDFITVIGSNGAGKSTLLNTISGEYIPDSGSIFIDDQDVTLLPAQSRAAVVARVFQDPLAGSCGELTIAENLALAAYRGSSRGLRRALNVQDKLTYRAMLQGLNLGLEERLDTSMSALSGGQRQAISLLMATLSPLKILLLDEHTSALDPKTAAFIMDLTQQLITEKKLTALMVTHSLQQALNFGNRTIMMHAGGIIYDIKGEARKELTLEKIMQLFSDNIDSDRMVLC
ncbi:ABC transporter ATP-binding protein [Candidatus Odyssella thessalonicensis]|uniref:ABC transporter ATP-binding protein n=1 Tax=Candidatus Odyssella thessalonicensis TaxID=84647 RepID=UPI000225C1F7|nr:ATP-binding cassette domain-containing protein [Candidatus Odyssella thessalonicensis]